MTPKGQCPQARISEVAKKPLWAWALFGTSFLVIIAGVAASIAYGSSINEVPDKEAIGVGFYVSLMLFSIPGLYLSLRRPSHPVGWLLLGFAVSWSALGAGADYVAAGVLTQHGPLVGTSWIALIANSAWVVGFLFLGLIIFLFPTGSPPSKAWRWVVPAGLASTTAIVVANTLHPHLDPSLAIENPLAWEEGAMVLDMVLNVAFAVEYLVAAAVVLSIVFRYKNSRGVERQQLAFLTFAVAVAMVISILLTARDALEFGTSTSWLFEGLQVVGLASAGFIPVAIVIAIMRYGLYDLGRIVRRTIVYALVIVILGAIYSVAVFVTSDILPFGDNSVGIAASTLVVVALFSPIRKGVQGVVNRRFYRSPYDPVALSDELQRRLRTVVDSDAIAARWMDLVEGAFHPEVMAVWVNTSRTTGEPPA